MKHWQSRFLETLLVVVNETAYLALSIFIECLCIFQTVRTRNLYLLRNYADFPIINTFNVGDITEFSKHVPITFCLNCVNNDVNVNCEMPTKRIIWKNEDVEAFKCEIRSKITDNENIINDIDNPDCNVDK